ncbi:MAG: hypothetical protein RIS20_1687 [Bacteroidota bacterium]
MLDKKRVHKEKNSKLVVESLPHKGAENSENKRKKKSRQRRDFHFYQLDIIPNLDRSLNLQLSQNQRCSHLLRNQRIQSHLFRISHKLHE